MTYQFDPLLPLPWLIGFGAAALALCALLLWKRARGTWLRVLTGATLLAALTNPVIRQDEGQPISDIVLAVVDQSASNKIGNRSDQTNKALEDLKRRIQKLGNTELRVATVTSGTDDKLGGTRAFAALSRAMGDIPANRFAGAFLITDGEVHDVPEGKALAQLQGPIHSLITGSKNENDRKLIIDHAPRFALVGQDPPPAVRFHVEDKGGTEASIPVTITMAGQEPLTVSVAPGSAAEVSLSIPHAGQNLIGLSTPVRPGELSAQNNYASAAIEGIRDRLRVLLVSGQPNAGERTWRNLLKADASVDLVHFTILRPPEKQDGTPNTELSLIAFPTTELFIDKLDKFDLVIFDRYRREAILPDSYLANIGDYVKKGGALLVSSGTDFASADGLNSTPLGEILPAAPTGGITETPFKPRLTEIGERHPVIRDLTGASRTDPKWGKWFRLIDAEVPAADETVETLMQGPEDKPLLVLRRVEEGRVAQILSDQGWLWARGYDGGGPQAELLKRIAHWLMKEPQLEEEQLLGKQVGSDVAVERRGLADTYTSVKVKSPSGKTQDVLLTKSAPGIFTGRFTPAEPGLHTLNEGKLESAIDVGLGDAKEAADLLATTEKLRPLAEATGGGTAWIEDGLPRLSKQQGKGPFAGSGWMSVRANNLFNVTAIRVTSLFSTLLSLAALLLLACLMWWREGR